MNENGWTKISRKLKEEPLVPLGIVLPSLLPSRPNPHLNPQPSTTRPSTAHPRRTPANTPPGAALTVAALVNATRALRRGDSASAQRMFRARVGAQGFTLLAIVAGGMYYSQDRNRSAELRKVQEQQAAEEKRARWIRELEVRDEEEKALRARLDAKRRAGQSASYGDVTAESGGGEAIRREAREGSGVLDKLGSGWGGNGGKQDDLPPPSEAAEGEFGDEKKRNPRSSLGALGDVVGTRKSGGDKN